jgi:hypothetical protein
MEIGDLPPTYVRCRTWRHAWGPYDVETLPRRSGYVQTLRCERCGALRWYTLDRRGDVTSRGGRRYPDGYLLRGIGRLDEDDRARLRLMSVEGQIRGS